MTQNKPDKNPDTLPGEDRGENIAAMEPLLIRESAKHRDVLAERAIDLAAASTGLRRSLPAGIVHALATLVRAMNCYYSNLIEGHNTHPVDIERALQGDYSADPQKRDLQLEARAHIAVQAWIDEGGTNGCPTDVENILSLHKRFCEQLPEDRLFVESPDGKERVPLVPGALRSRDVQVGRHIPISPGALPRFLKRFEHAHGTLGKVDAIVSAATAHHRLLWLHPFLDGNGRVARLMSHAILRDTLDTGGIWSVSRGLARAEGAYKSHLAACDAPRAGDLDGRGNLSEHALAEFAIFFLDSCLDQVQFMESLMQPDRLSERIRLWTQEEMGVGVLPAKSDRVLDAVLFRGTLPRGDVAGLLDMTDRSARRVTAPLLERGVLTSKSPRAPLQLAFPAALAARWMPGLFPEHS